MRRLAIAAAVVAVTALWPAGGSLVDAGGFPVDAGGPAAAASASRPSCTDRPDATGAIDYLVFGHRQYEATGEVLLPIPMPSSIPFPGPRVGVVKRMLGTDPPGSGPAPFRDGDATCLPVGTELHSYFGQPVSTRIVAATPTGDKVYKPAAIGTGADLVSLRGTLRRVEILDRSGRVTGRIARPAAVRRFADRVEAAPLGAAPLGTARVVTLVPIDGRGMYRQWIWYPQRSMLGRIVLPTEINDMLRAADR